MHCGACVLRIESALKKAFPLLESVNVDLVQEEAHLVGEIEPDQVVSILKDIGYEAISVPNVLMAYRDPDISDAEGNDQPEYALSSQNALGQLHWGGILQKQLKIMNAPTWLTEAITWVPINREFWFCLFGTLFLLNNHFMPFSLIVATWLIFQGIWPVWQRGLKRLFQGSPDMETLITLGTLGVYVYSLLTMFGIFDIPISDSSDVSGENIGYQILPFITIPFSQVSHWVKHPASSTGLCFEAFGLIFVFYFFGKSVERAVMNWTVLNATSLVQQQDFPARIRDATGQISEVSWDTVRLNTKLVVQKGDVLSVDGKLTEGTCWVDESTWTGETHWQEKKVGDSVSSGSVVQDGMATLHVLSFPGQSKQDALLNKVLSTQGEKPPIQRLADAIAGYFVWGMLALSLLTAGISYGLGLPLPLILERTIAVLVVACPCAFGLATPIALRLAVSRLFEQGVLVNRWTVIDQMGFVGSVMMDKTGTVTLLPQSEEGMTVVCPLGVSHQDFLRRVATLETGSPHPLAVSLTGWAKRKNLNLGTVLSISESSGKGITGEISISQEAFWLIVGKPKWVQECVVKKAELDGVFTPTFGLKQNWHDLLNQLEKTQQANGMLAEGQWVAMLPLAPKSSEHEDTGNSVSLNSASLAHRRGLWQQLTLGAFSLEVRLNPTAMSAIESLKAIPVDVMLLSGDSEKETAKIAETLNVNYAAHLLPEDKQRRVQQTKEQFNAQAKQIGKKEPQLVAMVGDGLNDTLALAEADVSIAVGTNIDWVHSVSDVMIMGRYSGASPQEVTQLEVLPWMLRFSKGVRQIIKQNFVWACGFNALCVPLAMFGILNPMMASVAMSVSSLAVAINSLRVRTLLPFEATDFNSERSDFS
jgi:cation transport ATPase